MVVLQISSALMVFYISQQQSTNENLRELLFRSLENCYIVVIRRKIAASLLRIITICNSHFEIVAPANINNKDPLSILCVSYLNSAIRIFVHRSSKSMPYELRSNSNTSNQRKQLQFDPINGARSLSADFLNSEENKIKSLSFMINNLFQIIHNVVICNPIQIVFCVILPNPQYEKDNREIFIYPFINFIFAIRTVQLYYRY